MKSPLVYDSSIIKEFGITPKDDVELEIKIGHVRAQLDEIKKFLWRERVELLLAEAQSESDIEAMAAKAKQDIAGHRSNLKGVLASIRVLTQLQNELEKQFTK